MTNYIDYGVNLTDNQKFNLASAINNKTPLTLRIKHSNLIGNDELMLTKRQITKIRKSLENGAGTDVKISKTQIRRLVKQGGNLFTSLASLGAKVLRFAVKGISKAVPALATGAVSALGRLGIDKIFGKGINIPKKYFPMLPMIVNELTKSQIDQINKVSKTGGRLVIKPTRKQVEGGFLGTLASIGIPMAISLVSKMFGSGLQVDKAPLTNMSNVYVPQRDQGNYPYYPPPFYGIWNNTIGMGEKYQKKGKRIAVRTKQSIQFNCNSRPTFVNKALSNFDLIGWIEKLGIKHFRDIFSRHALLNTIYENECGIINLDDIEGPGTHWICYRNLEKNLVEYFDPFGLIMPYEIRDYLLTSGEKNNLFSG